MAQIASLSSCGIRTVTNRKSHLPLTAPDAKLVGFRCAASRRCLACHAEGSVSGTAGTADDLNTKGVMMMPSKHVLLCVVDKSEYLSGSSKEALAMACKMVRDQSSKMTVFVSDMGAGEHFIENVRWHLRDQGIEEYSLHDETKPSCVAASLGDVADEVGADIVILSSAAVHSKFVDANLLAEFVPCPLVLMP